MKGKIYILAGITLIIGLIFYYIISGDKVCKVGEKYSYNAINRVIPCTTCPEGYELKEELTWGPCPKGMSDCSAREFECVKPISEQLRGRMK